MSMRGFTLFIATFFLLASVTRAALAQEEMHALDDILQVAVAFMEVEAKAAHPPLFSVEVSPGRLDSRLRLRGCQEPLEGFVAPNTRFSGNTFVGIRCSTPVNWSLYVPVEVRVQGEVVVLSEARPRGSLVTSRHVHLESRNLDALASGYFTSADEVLDMVLRRAVQAGQVVTPHMVEAQRLIQRGQEVTLIVEGTALAVRAKGTALGDAAEGERVQVRNSSSQEVVEGVVRGRGIVAVSL